MRRRLAIFIAFIFAWAVLITGIYVYFTSIRGANMAIVNPILAAASLVISVMLFSIIGVPRRFDRSSWPLNVGPFATAVLSLGFWQDMPLGLELILLGGTAYMCVRLLEDEHMPFSLVRLAIIFGSFTNALSPIWGWHLMWSYETAVPIDDVITFWLPVGPPIIGFILTIWSVLRSRPYSFTTALENGARYPSIL